MSASTPKSPCESRQTECTWYGEVGAGVTEQVRRWHPGALEAQFAVPLVVVVAEHGGAVKK